MIILLLSNLLWLDYWNLFYLGDVVYAALPEEGQQITSDSECGAIGISFWFFNPFWIKDGLKKPKLNDHT